MPRRIALFNGVSPGATEIKNIMYSLLQLRINLNPGTHVLSILVIITHSYIHERCTHIQVLKSKKVKIIIDREAGEIHVICLVASICPSVCPSVCTWTLSQLNGLTCNLDHPFNLIEVSVCRPQLHTRDHLVSLILNL